MGGVARDGFSLVVGLADVSTRFTAAETAALWVERVLSDYPGDLALQLLRAASRTSA
jgi:hypothetical protein